MPITEDYAFKIIIVGDSSVGKSCLLRRFQGENFDDGYPATFGVDFVMRRIEIDDKIVKLVIWDTAGQERFKALTRNYYQNADAVIVAFDVTNPGSYYSVPNWIAEAKHHGCEDLKVLIVACKCDIVRNRIVQRNDGQRIASDFGVMFMETSAKDFINVNETFISLAAQLIRLSDFRDQRLFEKSRKRRGTINISRQYYYQDDLSDLSAVVPGSSKGTRRNSPSGCKLNQDRSGASKCN